MNRLRREVAVFFACSRSVQVLLAANMIYGLVLPVIEIFVAAFVMRNSHAVGKVVTYQLSVYVATPVAFFLNGIHLGRVGVKHLYAASMLLSGVSMIMLMRTGILTPLGIAASGLATGLFWANRRFLALATTDDSNRNYYYGVETFTATLAAVVVPAMVGWFIGGATLYGWAGGTANHAYRCIAIAVLFLTFLSAGLLERGIFRNPPRLRLFPLSPLMAQDAAAGGSQGPGTGIHPYCPRNAYHASGRTGGNTWPGSGDRWSLLCLRVVYGRPDVGPSPSQDHFCRRTCAVLPRRGCQCFVL
jgi:hypothetical protein